VTPVEWTAILALVGGAVDLAIRIARVIQDAGCPVEGCPPDVRARLAAADIPAEGDAMRRAASKAARRAAGLDRETIDARLRGPIDLVQREAVDGARDAADYAAEIDDGDTDPGDSAA
jgi:hypothetical protein